MRTCRRWVGICLQEAYTLRISQRFRGGMLLGGIDAGKRIDILERLSFWGSKVKEQL